MTTILPEAKMVDVNLEESIVSIEPEILPAICRRCGKPFQRKKINTPTTANYYRCPNCVGFLAILEDSCNIS
jgi:predicted Zn-ribbon and HTH transcriptional regulator|tara:strand:+ start:122 stop:337 length:216 start_codon:yes stop_codon:yes gene_type:complete